MGSGNLPRIAKRVECKNMKYHENMSARYERENMRVKACTDPGAQDVSGSRITRSHKAIESVRRPGDDDWVRMSKKRVSWFLNNLI